MSATLTQPSIAFPSKQTYISGATATGVAAATGYRIPTGCQFIEFTTVTNTNGACVLPPVPSVGDVVTISNNNANYLEVFPYAVAATGTINGNAVTNGTYAAPGTYCIPGFSTASFICTALPATSTTGPAWKSFNQSAASINSTGKQALVGGAVQAVVAVAGNTNLTIAQSGSIVSVTPQAGAITLNLPALATAAGVWYDIVMVAADGGANVTVAAGATVIQGFVQLAATVSVLTANSSNLIFAHAGPISLGDKAHLLCDGTNWYVTGTGRLAGSITVS